ncbi:MAG: NYN domain-containing protein [bacterium]|nr:NYN domain-containing protein [bacterium]
MPTSTRKTYLYIDGTSLFAGQYELFGPKHYLSFSFLLKEIKRLFPIDYTYFYASYMNKRNLRASKAKNLIAAEALFYREVKATPKVIFYKGHRSPTSGKEKGVDVHLAVDIVNDAIQKKCDHVVLMTGDADLIYPLEIIHIPTYAVFLPNRFSLEIAYKVKKAFVLNFIDMFKIRRKLPKHLQIVTIKKPRMINIRGR